MSQPPIDPVASPAVPKSPGELGRMLEACRAFLRAVADRELGADLRSKANASDLVQQTFLEACRDFDDFRGSTEAEFRAWVTRILLRNLAHLVQQYRTTEKRNVAREVPLEVEGKHGRPADNVTDSDPTPCTQMTRSEEEMAIRTGLARLSDPYRHVIELHFRERLPFEEVGAILGRSPEAARKLCARAVRQLQHEVRSVRR